MCQLDPDDTLKGDLAPWKIFEKGEKEVWNTPWKVLKLNF